MEVLLLVVLCLMVSACELSQITNPQFNEVADVQLQFHQQDEIHHRSKRKIIDYRFYPSRKWPVEVEFHFEDTLSDVQKRLLRSVITDDFEANTCLRFIELNNTAYARHQFMFFKENGDDINLCRAYIGRNNDTKTFAGQPLFLGANCFNYKGTLVHMIAATLGMYNEVQRPDRDSYIDIEWDNIATKGKEFFVKQSDDVVHYHGTPYDYGSAVHYSADAWLKDTLKYSHREPSVGDKLSYTVRPKDPKLLRLLGQKSELSFYDIEVINRAYCAHTCNANVSCSYGGYQDPNDCTKCKCPDGYAGDHCEDFEENVARPSHQCTPLSDTVTVTDEKTCVMSPGYELSQPYSTGDKCTWVLESPAGTYIDMWFSEDRFALAYASTAYAFCLHWVEIKYKGLDSPRGPRYCTLDLILTNPTLPTKFAPLISESNKVMVIFKSPQANLQSEYLDRVRRGFKLCFKISSVILSNSTASPSPSTESLPPSLPSTSAGPPTKSTEHNEAVAPGAVVKTDPPGKAKHSLTPLIVGIIAALLILLIVFGVIIMVLLYKRKRKQPPPVVTSPVSGMENPGYAHAAPVVTYHNPDSEKKLAVLDAFGDSVDDLPPKYDDVPPEDNVPRYSYAYSASPVESQPSALPEYKETETVEKDDVKQESDGPVYQNAGVSIKNLRSNFE